MIGIIDYGLGNIRAFINVYKFLGIPSKVIKVGTDFDDVTKLILPGVGAFDNAMLKLENSGLRNRLEQLVLKDKVPILGICVGMQMLARSSDEGELAGLGWIKAEVRKFDIKDIHYKTKIPHMGWNEVTLDKKTPLLCNLDAHKRFYFLHSYYFSCDNKANVIATSTYGKDFTSAVNDQNIFGVQFHPEKSHHNGIAVLKNFSTLS